MMSTPPIRTHNPLERVLSLLLVTLLVSGMPLHAWAKPKGGQVTEGDATISQHGNTTLIRAADGTIINYTGFDIGVNETVQFLQPHVAARVLNRIMSADPTQIDGSLIANGQVYIVNPTGVFFGDTAMVNVNGLVAAAGNITDENFMAGIDSFTNLTGPVENFGTIHANMVALLGNTVANHGAILAPDGLITMVAGDNVILTKMGEGIRVRVMSDGEPGSVDGTGVTNTGLLDAGDEGTINLTAGDVYSVAVAHAGTAVARRMHAEGEGLVEVTGDVTAGDVSLDGGSIFVDGTIDASGEEGGGSVMIGGERTRVAIVGPNATIMANAIRRGNGGDVIVAASDIAQIFGSLQAKGGAESGDGGFIETSAPYLTVDADIDATAENGDGGHWLIDPVDFEIVDSGAGVNQLTDEAVEGVLESGTDLTITTDGAGAEPGDITVEADADIDVDLTTNGGVRLTLQAHDSVTVDGTITATGDALDLTLSANDQTLPSPDGDAVGDVAVNDVIDTNGGSIEIFGEAIGLNAAITTQGGDFTVTSNDAITATDLIDTSGNSPGGEVVMVAAAGNIVTADIDSSGSDGDAAGGVRIEAQAGNVTTGNITARGGDNTAGDAGAGGQVGLSALGAVDFASIDSSGGDATVVV
ncbi:MAG: filamentous hemagglutinin N-terminal domain-containing protein, partial [Myxococcales bacterium]|nr:filamentous hemagglutinin N-terminal domain-containing protein [Myxococcales bacterium]